MSDDAKVSHFKMVFDSGRILGWMFFEEENFRMVFEKSGKSGRPHE